MTAVCRPDSSGGPKRKFRGWFSNGWAARASTSTRLVCPSWLSWPAPSRHGCTHEACAPTGPRVTSPPCSPRIGPAHAPRQRDVQVPAATRAGTHVGLIVVPHPRTGRHSRKRQQSADQHRGVFKTCPTTSVPEPRARGITERRAGAAISRRSANSRLESRTRSDCPRSRCSATSMLCLFRRIELSSRTPARLGPVSDEASPSGLGHNVVQRSDQTRKASRGWNRGCANPCRAAS